jgi:hypothetical protein
VNDAEARLVALNIVRRWPLRNVSLSETDLLVLRSIYTWRDFCVDFGFVLWFLNPKKLLAWLCGVLCRTCRRHDCGCLQYDMTITSIPVALPTWRGVNLNLRAYDQASVNAQFDRMESVMEAIEHADRDIQRAVQKLDRALEKLPPI